MEFPLCFRTAIDIRVISYLEWINQFLNTLHRIIEYTDWSIFHAKTVQCLFQHDLDIIGRLQLQFFAVIVCRSYLDNFKFLFFKARVINDNRSCRYHRFIGELKEIINRQGYMLSIIHLGDDLLTFIEQQEIVLPIRDTQLFECIYHFRITVGCGH